MTLSESSQTLKKSFSTFGRISEIDLHDERSWLGRFFVTLDVDWAPDFVLRDIYDLLEELGVVGTWFATHSSEFLSDLQQKQKHEVGVHPNFVPLLMGTAKSHGVRDVVDAARQMVPKAKSFRSHSLVQASPLSDVMIEYGFEFDCNILLPFFDPTWLKPWRHCNPIVKVPYVWDDYMSLVGACQPTSSVTSAGGLRVINIHPIHAWLNSISLSSYNSVKESMHDEPRMCRAQSPSASGGIRDLFVGMIKKVKELEL